jgi:hypothetical protein
MAIDARLAHGCETRQAPRGDIGETVEATPGELTLSLARLEIEADRSNLRPCPQEIEGPLQ